MTHDELLARVRADTGEDDDSVVESYLAKAREAVLNRRYPYAPDSDLASAEVPARYQEAQARLACVYWARRGAEGEVAHSENGVSRTYGDEDAILASIPPYIGIGGIR